MAVTNRYDTFKQYSKEQINSFRDAADKINIKRVRTRVARPRYDHFFVDGERVSRKEYIAALGERNRLTSIVDDWTKQASDYYKAFGSTMLAGSNVGVGNANVSVNEVPVDRTDPILDTTSTPRKKKRGDGSALALGL